MGWIEELQRNVNPLGPAGGAFKQPAGVMNNPDALKSPLRNMPQMTPFISQKPFSGAGSSSGFQPQMPTQQQEPAETFMSFNRRTNPLPNSGGSQGASPDSIYAQLIADLRDKIDREYSYDGAGDALVDQAFQGSLDALGSARTRTNDNYASSRDNIDTLTSSHVANIKGADRDAIQRIGGDLTSKYAQNYDGRASELSADRQTDIDAKTAMLKNLGIQDAGVGTVGDVQTAAIADNSAEKAGAMRQAAGYQAADETRNVEQAQSMANAGVERQTDLRRQLDGILGNLDNQEAKIGNDKSIAKLDARNADRANFQKEQGYYNDTLGTLLNDQSDREKTRYEAELKAQSGKGSGSNSAFDVVAKQVANATGNDAAPYIEAYNQALAAGGGTLETGIGDKTSAMYKAMIKYMKDKKGLDADPDMVGRVLGGIQNYGTDKLNAN